MGVISTRFFGQINDYINYQVAPEAKAAPTAVILA